MAAHAFAEERRRMTERQIAGRGVRDSRVLDAFLTVPRHHFVPERLRVHAYEDRPLDIGSGQTISQPYMVAAMTELLAPALTDRVLEIGTGSGYQTAILATLAGHVTSIERFAGLADRAQRLLRALEYRNVTVLVGDGTLGHTGGAPYDAIIFTAAAPRVPAALLEQLADGGRLVGPVGQRDVQRLVRVTRTAAGYREEAGIECVFVPLVGSDGWPD